jgi:formylglycine-generating enzyme required for sulfatase activity/predicted ATPase
MFEWMVNNLKAVLIFTAGVVATVFVTRYKEGIKRGTNFVIDSILSWVRIYFLILKRYKKSIIRSYRETKVGYRNLRLDLERNYISLKVHSFVHYKQKDADEEIRSDKLDVLEVMKKHRHLVILGGPGAGKTTLMQWLLLKYAYGQMKEELGEKLIPVFIALRSLESGQSVDDLLLEVLKQHHFKKGDSFIRKQMEKGKCLLIFDGMDEIIDETTRKKVIADICNTYGNLYGKSRILITSRTEGYPNDPFPGSFREREILDLDMEQVRNFIHGILKSKDKPEGLIQQIEESEGLKKFATNPLMLSLLTFVYQESYQKLPNDRIKVYNKCMQLMLQDRDASKGIYEYRNKFDADDKELLLRKLSFYYAERNKWRFTEEELLENWKENLPPNLKESDLKKLLNEVCEANGILKHLSGKSISFLHRTFQEYYSAKEMCQQEQILFTKENKDIYPQMAKKERHEITLFLVGMMDDASHFIKQILSIDPQLALECLVYAKRATESLINDVIRTVLTELQDNEVNDVCNWMAYLAHRYGLNVIIQYFSNAIKRIKDENSRKNLWQVIDRVMLTFSPRKGMVYVSSGGVQWGKEPGEWMPGFWMDIYPATNADYHWWIDTSDVKELPQHWKEKPTDELLVTGSMKLLPIVDVTWGNASAYSSHMAKRLPTIKEWRKPEQRKNCNVTAGFLNEIMYTKNQKSKKIDNYLARAHALTPDFTLALPLYLDRARNLAREPDPSLYSARELVREFNYKFVNALAYVNALAVELGYVLANAIKLANDFDLACDRTGARNYSPVRSGIRAHANALDSARNLAPRVAHAFNRARDHSRDLDHGLMFKKLDNYFDTAQNALSIIVKVLKKVPIRWTRKALEKKLEMKVALVDALVAYLEILQNPVPKDLQTALRQPGLLTPVNEFPPNDLGICGLIGNVWEWTSTKNEKGEHLICGGAWTEEKYDPDKEVWRPPEWRDINLGFRCVCDWDKIGEVKEPEGKVEVKAEVEKEE